MKAYQSAQKISVESQEDELSREEMQQVIAARTLITRIGEYEKYLETSALMKIDPYKKSVVELQYYVDSGYTFNYTQESENDYSRDLMTLYYNFIVGGDMSQNVIEDAGLSIDQASLSELLSASQADNSIFIKIICNDEEKMDAIAESVKTQLKEKESKLQIVGSHKLRLLGESQNAVVDNALVDRKGAISNTISILNTQLGTLKSGMNEQQLNLLDNEEKNRKDFAKTQVPQFNIKYAILGLGFGIFVICAWIAYKIGFATRLQSSEEIDRKSVV